MKKKFIIVAIVVAILASVIAVVSFIGSKGNDAQDETEIVDESPDISKIGIFQIDSISDMESFVKDNELVLQTSDDKTLYAVGDIGIAGQSVDLFIQTNENGSFLRVDGDCSVSMEEMTVDELNVRISEITYVISQLFDVSFVDYSIYDEQGAMVQLTTEEPLEKVLNENAKVEISVIDKDNTYWKCSAYIEDDALIIEFFHSYQKDLYKFESADVVLNGEKNQ